MQEAAGEIERLRRSQLTTAKIRHVSNVISRAMSKAAFEADTCRDDVVNCVIEALSPMLPDDEPLNPQEPGHE